MKYTSDVDLAQDFRTRKEASRAARKCKTRRVRILRHPSVRHRPVSAGGFIVEDVEHSQPCDPSFLMPGWESLLPKPERKTYYLISGEGEHGGWMTVETTERGIKQRLTRERCHGDRWARAFTDAYETEYGQYAGIDCETGGTHILPDGLVTTKSKEKKHE